MPNIGLNEVHFTILFPRRSLATTRKKLVEKALRKLGLVRTFSSHSCDKFIKSRYQSIWENKDNDLEILITVMEGPAVHVEILLKDPGKVKEAIETQVRLLELLSSGD